jgi:FAD/FMN-containing dehydrogenase
MDLTILKASGFKGDLVTPEHPDYESSIIRWSLSCQKRAQVVAYVTDEQDVSLVIKYARENNLDIAIKGGGHSTAGTSSSEGVVIDLSRYVDTVEVDADKNVAYVGGGAIWETVDKATCAKGLATVAGTVNHVLTFF